MAKQDASAARMEKAMAGVSLEKEGFLEVVLNHALEAEGNFLSLYEVALRKARDEEVRAKLTAFRADHERHVAELRGALDHMGVSTLIADEEPTPLAEGLAALLEQAEDDEALLTSFLATEDFSRHLYRWVAMLGAPEPVARVAQRALDDEERHYAWAATRLGLPGEPL